MLVYPSLSHVSLCILWTLSILGMVLSSTYFIAILWLFDHSIPCHAMIIQSIATRLMSSLEVSAENVCFHVFKQVLEEFSANNSLCSWEHFLIFTRA